MHLRFPIVTICGRLLRILIYARYSTEEQDASSIADQIAYCKRCLADAGIKDTEVVIETLSDAELSGELVSRPGIDEVRVGVADSRWDLIVGEDAGRFFRSIAPALDLVGSAVDHGIRVICINDDVDTCDLEHWEDRLTEALTHHARSNKYTSRRIRRKHEGLWEMGAAIGMLKPGYKRRPTVPAQMGEPAKGPFYDEIDSRWAPVIHEAYEQIHRGDPTWAVANWLTQQGLPKCNNAKSKIWTAKNVVELIRRPDYRGRQRLRDTIAQKIHESGKHKQKKNDDPEKVLTREMPHLQIVPDWLWYAANEAIDSHDRAKGSRQSGRDHPLTGIPRDSRGPLSRNFFCVCGAKMHVDGRKDGGYKCSKVKCKEDPCWNKASSLCEITHRNLGRAIVEQLLHTREHLGALNDFVKETAETSNSHDHQLKECNAEIARAEKAQQGLLDALEKSTDGNSEPPASVLARLRQREEELAKAQAKMDGLQAIEKSHRKSLSKDEVEDAIDKAIDQLLGFDREAGVLLRQLAPRIVAVPYMQFQSSLVVLRARFDLHLVKLLPTDVSALLSGRSVDNSKFAVDTVPLCVDLFERSHGPKYGLEALTLQQGKLTLVQIGQRLGISKRSAHIAVQYGKAMVEAGITDPYIELTERPANASRWR